MKRKKKITFIDLFAGIGGFHIAFEEQGAQCVFASDWDKYSRQTYEANFNMEVDGDIKNVNEKEIPAFDILCAGFPCQPFSIAGVSKKNSLGRKHGFECEKQGNLFFEIIRIARHHRPRAMFLENVKNLKSHDKGNTWKVIMTFLEDLNYDIFFKIVDGKNYVPQHRERVFIVCFDRERYKDIDFKFPDYPKKRVYELKDIIQKKVDSKYTLSDKLWNYLHDRKKANKARGVGFGYGLIKLGEDTHTRTMSARYHKDGSEILIYQGENKNPRRLTPQEAAMLQGFPKNFKIPVSETQAYRQFGNSVVVPAISATAKAILEAMKDYDSGKMTKVKRFRAKQTELFSVENLTYA